MKQVVLPVVWVGCLAIVLFSVWSCENPSGTPYPNTAPETRLANIPANDTIALYILQGAIPEQTLYWVADDPDGFVVAYKYRWIDVHRDLPETTQWNTILNLTNLVGTPLDTLIKVSPRAGSVARVYRYFATLNPADIALITSLDDSLGSGHYFAVPYATGPVEGDSVRGVNPIQIEAPTKGIFIFNSPADSNLHRFEVSAIDNNDAADLTPAVVHFWTLRSPNLIVYFTGGPTLATPPPLITTYPTEVNPGLNFTFGATDPSTNDREYAWSVDDTAHWSPWSREARARISGIYFQNTGSDTHRVFMHGRNRWGVISPTVSQAFRAELPAIDDPLWPRRTLLINNTRNVGPGGLDSTILTSFYLEILDSLGKRDSVDIWNTASHAFAFPTRGKLGRYTNVLLVCDLLVKPLFFAQYTITGDKYTRLREYLNVGGKIIYSGTAGIRGMINPFDTWASQVLHAIPTNQLPFRENTTLDFAGARGTRGYPNIRLDSAKVTADSNFAIRQIGLNYPRGFALTISFFDSRTNDPFFESQPVGIRYLAGPATPPARPIFSVVHFGIPLYFANKSDVLLTLKKAFEDIKENSIP